MNKSNQSLRTLGWLSVGIGSMLLGFVLWGTWSDAQPIGDKMTDIIIAICAIGSGIMLLMKARKQS